MTELHNNIMVGTSAMKELKDESLQEYIITPVV